MATDSYRSLSPRMAEQAFQKVGRRSRPARARTCSCPATRGRAMKGVHVSENRGWDHTSLPSHWIFLPSMLSVACAPTVSMGTFTIFNALGLGRVLSPSYTQREHEEVPQALRFLVTLHAPVKHPRRCSGYGRCTAILELVLLW